MKAVVFLPVRLLAVESAGSSLCKRRVYSTCSLSSNYPTSLFLALVAYFGLGAYYNYSTYGATGKDLIPYVTFPRKYVLLTHML